MAINVKTPLTGNEKVQIIQDPANASESVTTLQAIADLGGGGGGGTDLGNILFVSKNGNNGTAIKGDLTKPWADPWAAIGAAISGDLVYVFSGTWTVGVTGAGTDYEIPNLATPPNLHKQGVTWYFDHGAKIEWADIGNDTPVFFSIGLAETLVVKGHLQFSTVSSLFDAFIYTRKDCIIDFEFDTITLEGYYTLLTQFDYDLATDAPISCKIKGNKIINLGNSAELDFGDRSAEVGDAHVVIDIDEVNVLGQFAVGASAKFNFTVNIGKLLNGFLVGFSGDSDMEVNIDHVLTTIFAAPIELHYGNDPPTIDRAIVCNINSLIKRVLNQPSGGELFLSLGSYSGITSAFRTSVTVNVNNAVFDGTLSAVDAALHGHGIGVSGNQHNHVVKISGNFYTPVGGHINVGTNSGAITTVHPDFILDVSNMKLVKNGTGITTSILNRISTTPVFPLLCEGFMSNEAIGANITKIGTELINVGIK